MLLPTSKMVGSKFSLTLLIIYSKLQIQQHKHSTCQDVNKSRSLIWRWFGKVNEGDQARANCKGCESEGKQITLGMEKGTT